MGELNVSYETLTAGFLTLAQRYTCAQYDSIGESICGRKIPVLRLGSGTRRIVYCAGQRGTDLQTAELLYLFAEEYCRGFAERKSICSINIQYLSNTRTVYLLPILNPDGTVLAQTGTDEKNPLAPTLVSSHGDAHLYYRGNARGVDLSRNFDAGYEMGADMREGARPVCGLHPESEPETAAVCAFLRAHAPVDMLISFRSGAEKIGWDGSGGADAKQKTVAGILSRLTGYPLAAAEGSGEDGSGEADGLRDWFFKTFRTPAFTAECGPGALSRDTVPTSALYERLRPLFYTATVLG